MSALVSVTPDSVSLKYLSDNRDRYIAQSILHGFVDDPLPDTAEHARDVIAWAASPQPSSGLT